LPLTENPRLTELEKNTETLPQVRFNLP